MIATPVPTTQVEGRVRSAPGFAGMHKKCVLKSGSGHKRYDLDRGRVCIWSYEFLEQSLAL